MASHPAERGSPARLTAEVAQDLDPGLGRLSGTIDHLGPQGLLSHAPATRPILIAASLRMMLRSASLREVVTLSVASRATVRSLAMISWSRGDDGPSI